MSLRKEITDGAKIDVVSFDNSNSIALIRIYKAPLPEGQQDPDVFGVKIEPYDGSAQPGSDIEAVSASLSAPAADAGGDKPVEDAAAGDTFGVSLLNCA